jgi:hypothetical protein
MAETANTGLIKGSNNSVEKKDKEKQKGLKTEPLWLSVSETASVSGVKTKTIRRAIAAKTVKYKVINNRYFIEFGTVLTYLKETTKLANKLYQFGIGQYVEKWRK